MESPNLEITSISEEELPSYVNTLNHSNRRYSRDDMDLERGIVDSEVCQICFNIIWDHICLACPNKNCDCSNDKAICSKCAHRIFNEAHNQKIDFKCPFCRTIIIAKEDYVIDPRTEIDNIQQLMIDDDNEGLVIVFNPGNRQKIIYYIFLRLFICLMLIYMIYCLWLFTS